MNILTKEAEQAAEQKYSQLITREFDNTGSVTRERRADIFAASIHAAIAKLIEQGMARKDESFAWKFGVRLIEHTVQRLHAPILDWIDIARQGKGGKPRMVERDYLITKLAENSEAIIGKPPTPSKRFLALCNTVLGACMLNTEGLQDAVERTLRARKVKNGEGLARPKARKKNQTAP